MYYMSDFMILLSKYEAIVLIKSKIICYNHVLVLMKFICDIHMLCESPFKSSLIFKWLFVQKLNYILAMLLGMASVDLNLGR